MDLEKLWNLIKEEEPYRVKQIEKSLYSGLASSWDEVTVLPLSLRKKLQGNAPIDFDFRLVGSAAQDSQKVVLRLKDGLSVESVLLRHKDKRNTVCVSSQVGCAMGCFFCRTSFIGYKRNLDFREIINQVLFFSYYLKESNSRVTNVVFMGMGEPFLNYENVINAIRTLNDAGKFNIGSRKISISTCGIPHMIEKFARENLQVNLAISLNAPNDELRSRIMPVDLKYPIEKLMASVKKYIQSTRRRVMMEYVLIEGINDSPESAKELGKLLKGVLCFINLIPFNASNNELLASGKFKPPSSRQISEFRKILQQQGLEVTRRYSFGRDIAAACGQLVYDVFSSGKISK